MLVSGEGAGLYRGHDGILRYLADVDEAFEEWHPEESRFVESETAAFFICTGSSEKAVEAVFPSI